jgi:GntR family transcriptional regulator / MocR family aminotransferase
MARSSGGGARRQRAARLFEVVDHDDAQPLQAQIFRGLRRLISDGVLSPGAKLPSSRRLAEDFGVSRNTVVTALEQLSADGWVDTRQGSGTFVSRTASPRRPSRVRSGPPHDIAEEAPFAVGLPGLDLFPMEAWNRLQAGRWRKMPRPALREGHSAGWSGLRATIASHVRINNGVDCDPAQVIITNGARSSIYLAGRALAKSGDRAWIEDPGYFGAKDALRAQGIELVSVKVDAEGIDIEQALQLAPDAKLAVVTSQCQFPTGATLSHIRRRALAAWAIETGGWVIDDGYDSEFLLDGTRPRPMMADLEDRTVFAHSFNHSLFPALRVGYLIVPRQLIDTFAGVRGAVDGHSNVPNQMVLNDFIESGQYDEHIRRCREAYAERRSALLEALREHLGGCLKVCEPARGLHIIGAAPQHPDSTFLARRAKDFATHIVPMGRFAEHGSVDPRFLMGFSGFNPAMLRAAVKRLAHAFGNPNRSAG